MSDQTSDNDLKETMRAMTKVAGVRIAEHEVDRVFAAFKDHLAAIDTTYRVPLAPEDEPGVIFRLDPDEGRR